MGLSLLDCKNKKERSNYIVAAVFMAICLIHCLYYCILTKDVVPYGYDENNYIACAKRIVEEGRFSFWGNEPDAYVSPVFPLFLALNIKIFGAGQSFIVVVRFIQAIMMAIACYLGCRISYEITGGNIPSIFAGIFLSFNATLAYYSTYLLTEPLCYFLTMIFIYVFTLYIKGSGNKKKMAYLAGLFYGLAIEVRPPIAVLIPLFVFMMWKKSDNKEKLLFAGGLLTPIIPWTIRNAIVLKKFVPFSTQTNAFYYGFCPDPVAYGLVDTGTILGNIKYLITFIKSDPLGELRYMTVDKFIAIFFRLDEICGTRTRFPDLDLMVRIFFVCMGFFGVVFGLISKKYRKISITIIVFLLSTFLVIPTVRYGIPFYPMLGMFTGIVIESLYREFSKM